MNPALSVFTKTALLYPEVTRNVQILFFNLKNLVMKKINSLLASEDVQSTIVILSVFLIVGFVVLVSKH